MLRITIPGIEKWDEDKQEFIYFDPVTLDLEHSLASISKWEANWCKPFLASSDKSTAETIDYIKCMCLDDNISPEIFQNLTNANVKAVTDYIARPMTATTFSDDKKTKASREIITSEIIYYWMIALNIPMECQYWHLNRLLTLVRVCNVKNAPPKKMSNKEILSRNAALNAARKKQLNTRG